MSDITKGTTVYFASIFTPPDDSPDRVLITARPVIQAGASRVRVQGRGDYGPKHVDLTPRDAVLRERAKCEHEADRARARLRRVEAEAKLYDAWLAENSPAWVRPEGCCCSGPPTEAPADLRCPVHGFLA